jgi:hypothetical protein
MPKKASQPVWKEAYCNELQQYRLPPEAKPGDEVQLYSDAANDDPKAIKVLFNNHRIGFIKSADTHILWHFKRRGAQFFAIVRHIIGDAPVVLVKVKLPAGAGDIKF